MINTQNVAPGIPCPIQSCGNKIKVTIQDLLYNKVIKCPHCLVEFTMSDEALKDTKSAMADLNHVSENAEKTKGSSEKSTD
tara:strand:- start:8108 stop:8350 length:243 start_codon:yes stop_codon:yes gene_type:complete